MKLRTLALVLAIGSVCVAARGQAGVYLTFNAQQFTQEGIYVNPGTHTNIDKPWLFGPGYGVYYNLSRLPYLGALKTGPFVIGIDGRGETLRLSEYGSQLDRQDGLFSLRVSTKKPFMKTTPYLQGGFGIGHTRIPFQAHYQNNFIYQFGIGADRKISRHFDWRVEGNAGFLGSYTVGAGPGPNQSNYLVTVDTGVVYRFR